MDAVRFLLASFASVTGVADLPTYTDARSHWTWFRRQAGRSGYAPLFTAPEDNVKLSKDKGTADYGLSLAPHTISTVANVCRYSTPECRKGCVSFSGKGGLDSVQQGRVLRTEYLVEHPLMFVANVVGEIERMRDKHGTQLRVRLNTFSDITWEAIVPWLFDHFGDVSFYDYTKWPLGSRTTPPNYHLTYSVSEHTTDADVQDLLGSGHNVATVFGVTKGHALPATWNGFPVIDGDVSDDRTADPRGGVVVGLRAKGSMRKGDWGMVRSVPVTTQP